MKSVRMQGKSCKRCGGTERYTINRSCTACALESSLRRAAKLSEQAAKIRGFGPKAATVQGKPCKKCGGTERYLVNKGCVACLREKTRYRSSAERQKATYYLRTPERVLRCKVRSAIYDGRARLRKLGRVEAQPISIDALHTLALEATACVYCGRALVHEEKGFDHAQPLARGGTHLLENIRICCQPCNRAKGSLTEAEYHGLLALVAEWEDGGAALLKRLRIGFIGKRMG
jgi:5-methylcytosine-specific restriction endonuclease McrA